MNIEEIIEDFENEIDALKQSCDISLERNECNRECSHCTIGIELKALEKRLMGIEKELGETGCC